MHRDVVQRVYDSLSREHGFARRSGILYKDTLEVIAMLELQRSDYGRAYYINVGFVLRSLHDVRAPTFGLSDIRIRADTLIGDSDGRLRELLDLENNLDEEKRESALLRILGAELVPMVDAGSTLAGLRDLQHRGRLRGFIQKRARAALFPVG